MPAPGLQRRRSSISHKAAELDGSGRKVSTTFDSAKICALTCHGIAPARGVSGVSSKAKINQDRGVVCWLSFNLTCLVCNGYSLVCNGYSFALV